ncbi:MAG: hypothetical protein AB7N76_36560 [Planctomycetota bacterium]
MAMSEEQRKDLKLKLTLLTIVVIIGVPIAAAGPYLGKVRDHFREKAKEDPNAPHRYVQIAMLYSWTGRQAAARETCEEFWKLFMSDQEDYDSIPEANYCKYAIHRSDGVPQSYMPWLLEKFPDGVKPEPVRKASRDDAAEILELYANILCDEKPPNYPFADHIHTLLASFWPPGSKGQKYGADGLLRMKQRSY